MKMTTLYRYKNNRKADGTFSRAHFIIGESGIVYKLSGCDEYIVGSYDVNIDDLEPCGKWGE